MCALQGGLKQPRINSSCLVDYHPIHQTSDGNIEIQKDDTKSKSELIAKSRHCSSSHEDMTLNIEHSRPFLERRMSLVNFNSNVFYFYINFWYSPKFSRWLNTVRSAPCLIPV